MGETTEANKTSKLAWLNKVPKKWRTVIAFSFISLSLIVGVLAGGLDNGIINQISADYIAKVVSGGAVQDNLLSLIVESNDEETYQMPDSHDEFLRTYARFQERRPYYTSVYNADKEHTITVTEIPDCPNLSVLYARSFSTVSYNEHYKHEYFPTELMFEGEHDSKGAYSFCYISQSQANSLLKTRGHTEQAEGGYLEDEYQSLIGTFTTMKLDGTDYSFCIANIYLEENYYHEGLKLAMGDYIVAQDLLPDGFERQAIYFLNDYAIQNQFLIEHYNNTYSRSGYSMRLNTRNVVGEIDESQVTAFFYERPVGREWATVIMILLIVFASLLALLSIVLCSYWGINKKAINLLIMAPFAFTPYLIFKLIFAISRNIYLYSTVGMATEAIILFAYLLLYAISCVWKPNFLRREEDS